MSIWRLYDSIIDARSAITVDRALLVGISGIDASGKGCISNQIDDELKQNGLRVAVINADAWLNLPHVRFNSKDLAQHFYEHALRLNEMFERLIVPLRENRSIELTMEFAEETATSFRPQTFTFDEIDIVLLEGIFIFKREFATLFDLHIWIDCSLDTALQRAIARGQENLTPTETVAAYETIYFPAQRIHFERDDPRSAANVIFENE